MKKISIPILIAFFSVIYFSEAQETSKAPGVTADEMPVYQTEEIANDTISVADETISVEEESEEEVSGAAFDAGADLVSRYVWRGLGLSSAPAVQPWVSYSMPLGGKASLEVGAWGSYSFQGLSDGSEADLYATLSLGMVSFTVTDYFFPSDLESTQNYFDYGNHVFEGMIGLEKGNFSASFGYYFAGDAANDDIYVELGYTLGDVDLFVGGGDESYTIVMDEDGLPQDGDFDIINVGLTYNKEIKSIPAFGSLMFNPDAEKIYIVFGVSF